MGSGLRLGSGLTARVRALGGTQPFGCVIDERLPLLLVRVRARARARVGGGVSAWVWVRVCHSALRLRPSASNSESLCTSSVGIALHARTWLGLGVEG